MLVANILPTSLFLLHAHGDQCTKICSALVYHAAHCSLSKDEEDAQVTILSNIYTV